MGRAGRRQWLCCPCFAGIVILPTDQSPSMNGWQHCLRCKEIPAIVSVDFLALSEDQDPVPEEVYELPGLEDDALSSGYKQWEVTCDRCGTRYQAEVDVEPMVWDFRLRRLS